MNTGLYINNESCAEQESAASQSPVKEFKTIADEEEDDKIFTKLLDNLGIDGLLPQ